jgi:hypothetical protein
MCLRLKAISQNFTISLLLLLFPASSSSATDCEIVSAEKYQKSQQVIVTDWHLGYPYKKQTVDIYQCARITFKINFWQGAYTTDTEVTVVFADKQEASQRLECEKRRIEFEGTFSCEVCFKEEVPIEDMHCSLR